MLGKPWILAPGFFSHEATKPPFQCRYGPTTSGQKWLWTLAGVVQWLECQPLDQRVAGSISGQGHIPGLQVWSPALIGVHAGGNQSMWDTLMFFPLPPSPHPSLPSTLSENQLKKNILGWGLTTTKKWLWDASFPLTSGFELPQVYGLPPLRF